MLKESSGQVSESEHMPDLQILTITSARTCFMLQTIAWQTSLLSAANFLGPDSSSTMIHQFKKWALALHFCWSS